MLIKLIVLKLLGLPSFIWNYCIIKYRHVQVENNVKIKGRIHIYGRGRVELYEGVRINSNRASNPIGGDTATVFSTGIHGIIRIGAGTGISNSAIVAHELVEIGKNVRIGGSTHIYDTDFHSLNKEIRVSAHDDDVQIKPVNIGDNVFIGARCTILKGVTIGEGSIVGASSVVTKDIPPNEIWAGNPARFIRKINAL